MYMLDHEVLFLIIPDRKPIILFMDIMYCLRYVQGLTRPENLVFICACYTDFSVVRTAVILSMFKVIISVDCHILENVKYMPNQEFWQRKKYNA